MSPAGNPFLYGAVLTSAAALLAGVYLPALRALLGTSALAAAELGLALAVGSLPLVGIEAMKALRSRRDRVHRPFSAPAPETTVVR